MLIGGWEQMSNYVYIQNDKINGIGQAKCLSEEITNIVVTDEVYNDIERYIYQDGKIILNPNYETEQQAKEQERIAMLNLTGADVERAIYKAKGLDFDDILSLVEAQPVAEGETPAIDLKALRIELKANNFYRGNPYIDQVGALLGFTSDMLNRFFTTNDYRYLTTCTLTVNTTPEDCEIDFFPSATVGWRPEGTQVEFTITKDGYKTYTDTVLLATDKTVDVVLEKLPEVEDDDLSNVEAEKEGDIGNERVGIDKSENINF